MSAYAIVLICLAAALACALLRPLRPELAMGVALAGGIAALFALRDEAQEVVRLLQGLVRRTELTQEHAGLLLRACGIALASEFGAELCRDAGESALAGRVELGASVALLAMSAPLIEKMLALAGEFVP